MVKNDNAQGGAEGGQVDAGQKGSMVGQIEVGDGRPAELNLDSTAVPGGDLSQVMRLFSFNFSLYTDSRLCQNSICLIFKRFDLTPILIQFAPIANMQFWNVKKNSLCSAPLSSPVPSQTNLTRIGGGQIIAGGAGGGQGENQRSAPRTATDTDSTHAVTAKDSRPHPALSTSAHDETAQGAGKEDQVMQLDLHLSLQLLFQSNRHLLRGDRFLLIAIVVS